MALCGDRVRSAVADLDYIRKAERGMKEFIEQDEQQ